jgi:hypothetical protein
LTINEKKVELDEENLAQVRLQCKFAVLHNKENWAGTLRAQI